MSIDRKDFGADFSWGVSTAAYQIEGGYNVDGKGLSIWDIFSNKKGRVFQNANANITCDFYHRHFQDLALLRSMNIPNFRFSLSWSRIIPNGTGEINKQGIKYYNRVIDFCLELGIEPWVTIYHWDLPDALERKGGWTNRDIIGWFSDFTAVCINAFGDRVRNWMILNEPLVFTGAGYFLGVHAPGRKGLSSFLAAAHHAAICQAEGARISKSINSTLNVGTTFSCSYIDPFSLGEQDQIAALKVDALLNRTFIEPLLGLGYPVKDLKLLQRLEPYVKDGDERKLAFDPDFIGLQNYTREVVAHSYFVPYLQARILKADQRQVYHTVMNWEVYPESMYKMLKRFGSYNIGKKIIVTENGAAFNDVLNTNEGVNDEERKQYLQAYIEQVLRSRKEGINVQGYFVWSFMDNFEWAEGFRPRFGLVYVDYKTQKRTIKSSGYWYRNFLGNLSNSNILVAV